MSSHPARPISADEAYALFSRVPAPTQSLILFEMRIMGNRQSRRLVFWGLVGFGLIAIAVAAKLGIPPEIAWLLLCGGASLFLALALKISGIL